jgi:hypothetical protein
MELTAAGQSRIYTGFPFNHTPTCEPKSDAKIPFLGELPVLKDFFRNGRVGWQGDGFFVVAEYHEAVHAVGDKVRG